MNLPFKIPTSIAKILGIDESPLLPADERQARPLAIVVAIMAGLGCLAALIALSGFRAANNWTNELKSAITVLVYEPKNEANLQRAVQISSQTKGVISASVMGKEKAKLLLRNYGANIGTLIDELPVPALLEIGIEKDNKTAKADLQTALNNGGFKFEIDDHSRYSGEIVRASRLMRIFALMVLTALIIASVASIAFAARAALETRREAVEILHLVGAEDAFVAREVQARFMVLGFQAGLFGSIGAAILLLIGILINKIGSSELTQGASLLKWYDIWILLIAPLVTSFASAIAARLAARETLRELV